MKLHLFALLWILLVVLNCPAEEMNASSIKQLVEQIDVHFSLPSSTRQLMSEQCSRIASQYRVEDNARQVAQVFEEVLREKNAA